MGVGVCFGGSGHTGVGVMWQLWEEWKWGWRLSGSGHGVNDGVSGW